MSEFEAEDTDSAIVGATGELPVRQSDMTIREEKRGAVAAGAVAVGALAIGAFALGALAIGALAIGKLSVGKARIRRLTIDELHVRKIIINDRDSGAL